MAQLLFTPLYRLNLFMLIGMSICYTIYTVLPNGQNLRPSIEDNDMFSKAIKRIYSSDTPTNVAPSIHVLNSIAVHVGLVGYEPFKEKRPFRLISMACMISICASTVMIKQHSILDVIWGIVLSIVLYVVIYVVPQLLESRNKRREAVTYF